MKNLAGRDANILKITGESNSQQNISESLFRQGNRMPLLHLCYAICNTANSDLEDKLPMAHQGHTVTDLLTGETLTLAPYEYRIYKH